MCVLRGVSTVCKSRLLFSLQLLTIGQGTGKSKAVVGKHSTTREQGAKVPVVTNSAEDAAASFDIGAVSDSATQRTQPMRVVELHSALLWMQIIRQTLTQQLQTALVIPVWHPVTHLHLPTAVILQVLAPPVPPAAAASMTPLSRLHHLQKKFAAAASQARQP